MTENIIYGVFALTIVGSYALILCMMLAAILRVTRYSLRHLLVVMTVVAVGLGLIAAMIRR